MFESLIPRAIQAGIRYFDYWDYTLGEIILHIEAHTRAKENEIKLQAQMNYQTAVLITLGVGKSFGSKSKFPSLYEAFPSLFEEDEKEARLLRIKNNLMSIAAARKHKEVIKKDDRTT